MGKTILITLVVAIVVGAAAAFGGYKMGDTAGFERANLVRQQFAQSRQGGQGQFGQGANAGGANRAFELQGTVKSVDGDTLTVTVGQRDVTVKLSNTTQILKSVASTRTDLAAGEHVIITPATSNAGSGAGAGTGSGGGTGASGGGVGGAGGTLNAATITVVPSE